MRTPGPLVRSALDAEGRVYRLQGNRLLASPSARKDPWEHPAVAGSAAEVAPSPDGKWVAIQQKQDIYLAPLPARAPNDSVVLELGAGESGLKRLTAEGGFYPHWRDAGTLELMSA